MLMRRNPMQVFLIPTGSPSRAASPEIPPGADSSLFVFLPGCPLPSDVFPSPGAILILRILEVPLPAGRERTDRTARLLTSFAPCIRSLAARTRPGDLAAALFAIAWCHAPTQSLADMVLRCARTRAVESAWNCLLVARLCCTKFPSARSDTPTVATPRCHIMEHVPYCTATS